jgi:hypothetical protein
LAINLLSGSTAMEVYIRIDGITALPVPTTFGGSSDPMYPKPLDARLLWICFAVTGKVYPPPIPQLLLDRVDRGQFSNGNDPWMTRDDEIDHG